MLVLIRHNTKYEYKQPVMLEPQSFRFRPREDHFQKLLKFKLSITPEPAGVSELLELDGNTSLQAWFKAPLYKLEIRSTALIETGNTNPFNYLVYPETALNLPMQYPPDIRDLLKPYLIPLADSMEITKFAQESATEAGLKTIEFLSSLQSRMNREFRHECREIGEPYQPEKTLALKKGSCRDFAVLFMAACRTVGIATRFVSGYHFDGASERQYLHAWVEAYLPGAGWRGFDPTIKGGIVADKHIAVATSANPRMTAPVSGMFHGNAVGNLATEVAISAL